ncbi:hypothetical protein ACWGCW_10005 [Streptomyces sp. NPDC054933]
MLCLLLHSLVVLVQQAAVPPHMRDDASVLTAWWQAREIHA